MITSPYKYLEVFPSSLQIQTISYCNYDCVICPYQKVRNKIKHGRISDELFEKILEECKNYRLYVKNFFLTLMNEPLLDRTIYQKVRQVKEALPECRVIIITNGSLLDEIISKKLVESSLDVLKVSLNGYYLNSYLKKRDKKEINRVNKNIDRFIKINNNRVRLIISVVYNKLNEPDLLSTMERWQENNITCLITPFSNRTGAVDKFNDFVVDRSRNYDFREKCSIPFSILNVLQDGRVLLCCNDWFQKGILGNINEQSIVSIWNNARLNKYREVLTSGILNSVEPCNMCQMNI